MLRGLVTVGRWNPRQVCATFRRNAVHALTRRSAAVRTASYRQRPPTLPARSARPVSSPPAGNGWQGCGAPSPDGAVALHHAETGDLAGPGQRAGERAERLLVVRGDHDGVLRVCAR